MGNVNIKIYTTESTTWWLSALALLRDAKMMMHCQFYNSIFCCSQLGLLLFTFYWEVKDAGTRVVYWRLVLVSRWGIWIKNATQHNTTQHRVESVLIALLSLSLLNSFSHFFFLFLTFFSGSLFSLKLTRSEKWDLILELSGGRLMPINLLNSTGVKGAAAALTGNRPRRSSRRHSNCVIYVCKYVWFKIDKWKKKKKKLAGGEGERPRQGRRRNHTHQDSQHQQHNWWQK